MTKQEIEQDKGWKYISTKLNPIERSSALFGPSKPSIEKAYNVKIEEWPYSALGSVKEEMLAISVMDTFSNSYKLAVLIPNP